MPLGCLQFVIVAFPTIQVYIPIVAMDLSMVCHYGLFWPFAIEFLYFTVDVTAVCFNDHNNAAFI